MLKKLLNNYITCGSSNKDPMSVSLRVRFINIFSLIGMLSLISFSIAHLADKKPIQGIFEVSLALITLAFSVIFRKTKNINLMSNYIAFSTMGLLIFLIITGGYKNDGRLWFFIFPILAFFIGSLRKGILWMTILYIMTLTILFLNHIKILNHIAYPPVQVIRLLIVLFPISMIVYFYEKENVRNKAIIRSKTIEMSYKNELLKDREKLLANEVSVKSEKVEKITITLINALENVNHLNDTDTGFHIQRVSKYSEAISKAYGCDHTFCKKIKLYASLHDIGKVALPDSILLKPGKYSEEEFEKMKDHVLFGAEILNTDELDEMAKNIALYHHERWDGSGYPHNLEGKKIPLEARIVSIADVYDALSTKRPYKEPFPEEQIDGIMKSESGSHFDPELLKIFFKIKDTVIKIKSDLS